MMEQVMEIGWMEMVLKVQKLTKNRIVGEEFINSNLDISRIQILKKKDFQRAQQKKIRFLQRLLIHIFTQKT
jgi:hypothetical protein